MFVSTKDVSRDGLANVINMFAYKFIEGDLDNDCAVCDFVGEEFRPNVWTFRIVEKNKLNSVVYCDVCAAKIDDNDPDCFKIALPVSTKDEYKFEELLDRLTDCGGVWLGLNLKEEDCAIDSSVEIETENFFKSFVIYIQKFGQSAERIKPGPIYTINNELCICASRGDHFVNSSRLIDMLIDCILAMLPDKLNYYSRKNFGREMSKLKYDLLENVMRERSVIVVPENLEDLMPKELNSLKQRIFKIYKLEDDDIEEKERQFCHYKILKYADYVIYDFVKKYNKNPWRPFTVNPYCSTAAEAMYDFDQYIYLPKCTNDSE
ncbi:hypothetical protein [Trichoplusia ni single nucleopolyhedrovirus]|uniref:Uncharacterized protein n=1 Tax=Trichoplusia ni single nucleopolyhedrovirus TaxID=332054 RepID=Q461W2_9ABAC|nr:hypothetical protein TNSV_gp104 [Trichoplusia ni single nucleopolyhedrovirus]AAZ67474.1 hypothetical protein [Trichoplusia ni single nucleopolyhedrovirus]